MVYIYELEELDDILETLVFEDEPSIFTEQYAIEIMETALYLMDEYMINNPTIITEPNFHDILLEDIKEIFYIQMEEQIYQSDFVEDDLNELLEEAFQIFITTFYPERSLNQENITIHESESDISVIEEKIIGLRNIPQPVQRTPEWYQFRWNLITASNAYKAFESQSTINQLIYEKCQPLKINNDLIDNEPNIVMVNTNTTLHWGQKYEPLSVMIYENLYKTKVEDFGCIQHPIYKFLGASPDGINIDKNSDRYGRMLEIKNIVNREINGIPKKEYWVQMQLQMEVCDLDECDFLETKFTEYSDSTTFQNDTSSEICLDLNGNTYMNNCLSKDGKTKGIIIYFHTKEGKPYYLYKPLNIISPYEIDNWENEMLDIYENEPYNYIYMKTIYWKLDILSCVLVLRNKDWFKNNIPQLEKVWNTILTERITGYEHRAPNKKQKTDSTKSHVNSTTSQGCLLKFNKIIKVDTEAINNL